MSNIERLPSGTYRTRLYIGIKNGKRQYKSITAKTRQSLQFAVAEYLNDLDGQDPGSADFTLSSAVESYISSKSNVLSPATVRGYRTIQRSNLKTLMPMRLTDLTSDRIQRAINEEALGHSPKTVRNIYGLLTAVLAVYRPGFAPRVLLPRKKKTEIRIPTKEEIESVLALCEGSDDEVAIVLCAYEGMRRSEIAALTWNKVDFKRNTISIDSALVIDENCERVVKGTKTTAGTRTISIFPTVKRVLEKQKRVDERVCHLPLHAYYGHFIALQKRAGIAEPYRFHDLRHYFVSVCLALNIPRNYIADIVGHEHLIDKVYGHIMEHKKKETDDTLSNYFS